MKKKVVSYIRVSTAEQTKGFSFDAQRKVLDDCAEARKLHIVKEFVESESAFKAKSRPGFQSMLDYLRDHASSIHGVIVYKIDRLARNLTDFAAVHEMAGITIISATEPEFEGSSGSMLAGMNAVYARYFSEQLGERTSLGMRTKAEKGLWPSTAPIGYLNGPEKSGILSDPATAELIVSLFVEFVTGRLSLKDAASWAVSAGLKGRRGGKITRSQIHSILRNPIYYGDFVWKEKQYQGLHTPLISRALFDRVQERLDSRSHPKKPQQFPFRGLLQCGFCGCKITAERKKKTNREYVYYHCTNGKGKCKQPYVREENLGLRLASIVDAIHLSEEQIGFLMRQLARDSEEQIEKRKARIQKFEKERITILNRRDKTYTDKIDGKIAEEMWLRLDQQWEEKIDWIDGQIICLRAITDPQLDKAKATFELLKRAPELYIRQTDGERACLLKELLSNCIMKGETLVPIYNKPFDAVAVGVQTGDWYPRQDSNL